MAKRWPPMIGIVGFDGGYRPAVALALSPDELTSDEGEEEGGPDDETGACCNPDGSCDDGVTQFDCTSSGGTFQGVGTDCDPNPCEQPPASGACCVGTDCSIQTQDDCESGGGTYQGDDTTCDPNPCENPCVCGGFFNPDDGLYYNTKNYINTNDDSTCPSCPTCLCFAGPNPDPIQYPCGSNRWTFCGTYPVSTLLEEHYDEECNLVQTFEDVDSGWYCCCFTGCEDASTCTPYAAGTCPPCEGEVIPTIWTRCGTITTTVEYSDPCTPPESPFSPFSDQFFQNN